MDRYKSKRIEILGYNGFLRDTTLTPFNNVVVFMLSNSQWDGKNVQASDAKRKERRSRTESPCKLFKKSKVVKWRSRMDMV